MSRSLSRALAALAAAALALPVAGGGAADGTLSAGGRQLRVGLVLQISGTSDPFTGIAFAGFERAVKELGVRGRALTPTLREGYVPSFSLFARQKYDLVLGVGFLQAEAIDAAAVKFPQTRFAGIDVSVRQLKHRPKNVRGIVFATQEGGYLAWYLAALVEKRRPGKDVIGAVGGFKIPTVDAFIAGYQAGAKRADPGITVLVAYSQDFVDPAKCKAVALDQIAKGAGVVFQVAGGCGLGALEAARAEGVWGIGVDADQSFLGPHILTSVVKRLDVAAYDTIRQLVRGTFTTGGDTVLDLRDGGVGLGKISSKVPPALVAEVERIRRQIIAGKIANIPTAVR